MSKYPYFPGNMNPTAPFGFKNYYNGLDFSRSIDNPNSRLVRVVRFVRMCETPVFRSTILNNVFADRKSRNRGWGSIFFAGAVKAGFLDKVGRGNRTRYIEGRNATLIKDV